jgi:hypothetical protein
MLEQSCGAMRSQRQYSGVHGQGVARAPAIHRFQSIGTFEKERGEGDCILYNANINNLSRLALLPLHRPALLAPLEPRALKVGPRLGAPGDKLGPQGREEGPALALAEAIAAPGEGVLPRGLAGGGDGVVEGLAEGVQADAERFVQVGLGDGRDRGGVLADRGQRSLAAVGDPGMLLCATTSARPIGNGERPSGPGVGAS